MEKITKIIKKLDEISKQPFDGGRFDAAIGGNRFGKTLASGAYKTGWNDGRIDLAIKLLKILENK